MHDLRVASTPLTRACAGPSATTSGCSSSASATALARRRRADDVDAGQRTSSASTPWRTSSWSSATRPAASSMHSPPLLVLPLRAAESPRSDGAGVATSPCTCRRAPRPAPASRTGLHPALILGQPVPSSRTSTRSPPPSTRGSPARGCRPVAGALVTASSAMRYAATSTAAGNGSRSRPESTITRAWASPGPDDLTRVGPARCRRAETRPNWSSAGGRSPSTRRRTSPISSRARSESRPISAAARRVLAISSCAASSPHRQAGERWTEPVVQVTAQPPSLLLPRGHESLAGALQHPPAPTAWTRAPTWPPTSSNSRRSPDPNGSAGAGSTSSAAHRRGRRTASRQR